MTAIEHSAEERIGTGRRAVMTWCRVRGTPLVKTPLRFELEYGPVLTGWHWEDRDARILASPSGRRYRWTSHESRTGGDGVPFSRGWIEPVA